MPPTRVTVAKIGRQQRHWTDKTPGKLPRHAIDTSHEMRPSLRNETTSLGLVDELAGIVLPPEGSLPRDEVASPASSFGFGVPLPNCTGVVESRLEAWGKELSVLVGVHPSSGGLTATIAIPPTFHESFGLVSNPLHGVPELLSPECIGSTLPAAKKPRPGVGPELV